MERFRSDALRKISEEKSEMERLYDDNLKILQNLLDRSDNEKKACSEAWRSSGNVSVSEAKEMIMRVTEGLFYSEEIPVLDIEGNEARLEIIFTCSDPVFELSVVNPLFRLYSSSISSDENEKERSTKEVNMMSIMISLVS